MITTAELHRVAEKEGLRFDQVGKDYVILIASVGIGAFRSERARLDFQGRDMSETLLL